MNCPTCNREMTFAGSGEAATRHWCPGCGTLRYHGHFTDAATHETPEAYSALLAACRMLVDNPGLTAGANDVVKAAVARAEGRAP